MGKLARMVLNMKEPKKTPEAAQTKKEAYEVRTAHDLPYFQRLLKRLEDASQQPVSVGVHAEMIEQVGKQNAYRELLSDLRKDLETAERVIAMAQARQRLS